MDPSARVAKSYANCLAWYLLSRKRWSAAIPALPLALNVMNCLDYREGKGNAGKQDQRRQYQLARGGRSRTMGCDDHRRPPRT